MLLQDLFGQADLTALEIEIGQVAYQAPTGHAQRLVPEFDPAVPHPLASLVVGQKLAAQQGPRLLPERKRLIRGGRSPCLGAQVLKGIRVDAQAGLLRKPEAAGLGSPPEA